MRGTIVKKKSQRGRWFVHWEDGDTRWYKKGDMRIQSNNFKLTLEAELHEHVLGAQRWLRALYFNGHPDTRQVLGGSSRYSHFSLKLLVDCTQQNASIFWSNIEHRTRANIVYSYRQLQCGGRFASTTTCSNFCLLIHSIQGTRIQLGCLVKKIIVTFLRTPAFRRQFVDLPCFQGVIPRLLELRSHPYQYPCIVLTDRGSLSALPALNSTEELRPIGMPHVLVVEELEAAMRKSSRAACEYLVATLPPSFRFVPIDGMEVEARPLPARDMRIREIPYHVS